MRQNWGKAGTLLLLGLTMDVVKIVAKNGLVGPADSRQIRVSSLNTGLCWIFDFQCLMTVSLSRMRLISWGEGPKTENQENCTQKHARIALSPSPCPLPISDSGSGQKLGDWTHTTHVLTDAKEVAHHKPPLWLALFYSIFAWSCCRLPPPPEICKLWVFLANQRTQVNVATFQRQMIRWWSAICAYVLGVPQRDIQVPVVNSWVQKVRGCQDLLRQGRPDDSGIWQKNHANDRTPFQSGEGAERGFILAAQKNRIAK